jgi:hypothetical protein
MAGRNTTVANRVCLLTVLSAAFAFAQEVSTAGFYEVREYSAENGRKVRISSLGNIVYFESPMGFEHLALGGVREGYILGYEDPGPSPPKRRTVYDLSGSQYSRTISPPRRDLIPGTFSAPVDGRVFRVGEKVTAVAVVFTADNVLRLTHTITWIAGTGYINAEMWLQNRLHRPVKVFGIKHHLHPKLDGGGTWGTGSSRTHWTKLVKALFNHLRCIPGYCPPPPQNILEAFAARHVLGFSGDPEPSMITLREFREFRDPKDDPELNSPYPATINMRTEPRVLNLNGLVTLGWIIDANLTPAGTPKSLQKYSVTYTQQ